MATKLYKKHFADIPEDVLMKMPREEASKGIPDNRRIFCEKYIDSHNIIAAAVAAGYRKEAAHRLLYKVRQNQNCVRYLAWLKLRVSSDCHVTAMDVIDLYTRIAFSDITDFVDIKNNSLKVKDADKIDGKIIKSIKKSKEGITVELVDKLSALQKLEAYFDFMPQDWKAKIEHKKLELMEKRLELEKIKIEGGVSSEEDDGFLNALKDTAKEVWEDEENAQNTVC